MALVKDERKVRQLTTTKGWRYRVVEGTLRSQFIAESADGEEGAWWYTFQAHGKTAGTKEHVAIRRSEVAQIVEVAE